MDLQFNSLSPALDLSQDPSWGEILLLNSLTAPCLSCAESWNTMPKKTEPPLPPRSSPLNRVSLRSLSSGMTSYSYGNAKVRRDLPTGTVWLLSQDRKCPRLASWDMKALGGMGIGWPGGKSCSP